MTRDEEKRVAYVAFLLAVSIFGLIILTALLRNPSHFVGVPSYSRAMIAFVYDLVCVAGILAVLFPIACSRVFGAQFSRTEPPQVPGMRATRLLGQLVVHGHHPSGSQFTKHELLVSGRSFCATCYGLLTGAVVSLTIVTASAVSGWPGRIGTFPAYLIYYVGVVAVIAGLLWPLVTEVGAKTRLILAFIFVVGTSLMLLAAELLAASSMADLFVILLAVFWLLSRISISHRS